MHDPVTQSFDPRLLNDLKLQQVLKQTFDASVKEYADKGLLPQALADEAIRNTNGAGILKWLKQQAEETPHIRIPTGTQIVAQRDIPLFHDNRPDALAARICALRYADGKMIHNDGFIKILPAEE